MIADPSVLSALSEHCGISHWAAMKSKSLLSFQQCDLARSFQCFSQRVCLDSDLHQPSLQENSFRTASAIPV